MQRMKKAKITPKYKASRKELNGKHWPMSAKGKTGDVETGYRSFFIFPIFQRKCENGIVPWGNSAWLRRRVSSLKFLPS